jgi:hypothetical protein
LAEGEPITSTLTVERDLRALLDRGEAAEALYREAIDRLQPTRLLLDRARAQLLYGEWLRRQRRRLDSRKRLRVAHQLFSDFGMEAFAERARVELHGRCPWQAGSVAQLSRVNTTQQRPGCRSSTARTGGWSPSMWSARPWSMARLAPQTSWR